MVKEPLKHILRPNVPWRADALTECGKEASEFASVITADEAVAFAKEHGRQRSAFVFCMTCMSTCERHSAVGPARGQATDWRRDPIEVMQRYLSGNRYWRDADMRTRIFAELHAIGALIEAHREEFDDYVQGATDATNLSVRRTAKTAMGTYMKNSRK